MSVIESTKQFAPAGSWTADPVHSSVSFEVEYGGVGTFRGGFREFTARLDGSALTGTAKIASVDVKDENLSGHLQSPDFFDAQRFPEITVRADELTRHGDGTVDGSGEITIKGVTRPVELTGRIGSPNVDPFGREKLGLTLEASVDRNEFGVSWNAPNQGGGNYLGDHVKLIADLILARQED